MSRRGLRGLTPLANGFCFGRGPRWFEGLLWFSDTLSEAVHAVHMNGTLTTVPVPGHAPTGLGFCPDGTLLIASAEARQLLRYDGESISTAADLSDVVTANLGDMVVDHLGRAYVGCQARDGGAIVRVDPDGSVKTVAGDLDFPSGLVISPDLMSITVAESIGRRLTTFSIDAEGGLSDRRTFAEGLDGPPDGIALDVDGGVWVAMTLAHQFQRILPGGAVTDCIDVGDRVAIACTLGGPDRRVLFALSSSDAYSQLLVGSKLSRLDAMTVDIPGAGLP